METTARGDVPKTLHNIAFVSIPESADLEFLLWDLQDAIAAYARLSDTVLPHPVDLKADDAGAVDGIVLAVDDAFDDEAYDRCRADTRSPWEYRNTRLCRRPGPVQQRQADATKSSTACIGHVFYVTCHGATALSSAPAPASQRFATPRAWVSCVGHFRKRWISLWAPYAWAAPLSMRSCLAVAMPEASMPTAWCASSPRCPHRSGMPS